MRTRVTRSRLTRATRTTTALIAAATLSIGLAACSDSGDGDGSSNGDGDNSASADLIETKGTFPQTVSTKFGDVTVDEQPQRVVALGWGDAETALALGVQPVGASDWIDFGGEGVGPWVGESSNYETTYEDAPETIDTLEPAFEAIATLDPDLILDVRSSGDQERYDKLSTIATTVGVPDGGDSYLSPREEQVSMISTALGLAEDGEEINQRYDEMVAQIRKDHPEGGGGADRFHRLTDLQRLGRVHPRFRAFRPPSRPRVPGEHRTCGGRSLRQRVLGDAQRRDTVQG